MTTSGTLYFNNAPEFSNPTDSNPTDNVYNVTIKATDSNSNISYLDVSVTVINTYREQFRMLINGPSAITVFEKQTSVATYTYKLDGLGDPVTIGGLSILIIHKLDAPKFKFENNYEDNPFRTNENEAVLIFIADAFTKNHPLYNPR